METTRFENANHGLKVGETVKVFDGGKWHYGRITGFEQFEGSGLCFVDGLVRLSCFNYPVAHGAVERIDVTPRGHAFEEIPGAHSSGQGMGNICKFCGNAKAEH